MWCKIVGTRSFCRFGKIHAFDRQTDRRTDRRTNRPTESSSQYRVMHGIAKSFHYRALHGKKCTSLFLPTPYWTQAALGLNREMPIVFSEREFTFTFAICHRPSVCMSSVCRLSSVVCNVRAPYFRLVPNSVTLDDLERHNSPNRRVISPIW